MVLIPDCNSRNSSSNSDVTRAGTVKGSGNVSSVFICMPALPAFITHSNPNDSVCLHVRTDGRWNDNSSYFHPGPRFPSFSRWWHKCGCKLDHSQQTLMGKVTPCTFPPHTHRADFTEIKQNAAQPTGCTDVRKTHWTQNVILPDWRHRFKLQIQHPWKIQ